MPLRVAGLGLVGIPAKICIELQLDATSPIFKEIVGQPLLSPTADPMPTLKFEFWTPRSPADAGTTHPLYFTAKFNDGNLAQPGSGNTGLGEYACFEFPVPSTSNVLLSAGVRLNGLAPDAPDNWKPNRVKLTFGNEVLKDGPWTLVFDQDHRAHEVYRRESDPTQSK